MSSRNSAFGWLFVLLSTLGILIALEVGLRVLTDHDSKWNMRLGASKQFDPIVGFRNKPHLDLGQELITNEYGYHAPMNLQKEAPQGAIRVLFIGDSNSVTPRHTSFPIQTEGFLESELGAPVEAVNTAVPGYSSQNARLLFESEVSRFDADHAVIYLGWNDLGQYGPEGLPYKQIAQGYDVPPLQRFLSNVYAIRFVYAAQRYLRRFEPSVYSPLDEADAALYGTYEPRHFEENLRAIVALASERYPAVYLASIASIATITNDDPDGFELSTAHYPTGMDKNMRKLHLLVMKYDAVVRTVADDLGVELLDFFAAFDSREARRFFTDSCHMQEEGARRLAREVADAIERNEREHPTLPRS